MYFFLIPLLLFCIQTSFSMQHYYTEAEQAAAFTTFLKRQEPTRHACEILHTVLPEIHAEAKKNKFTSEQECALLSILCHAERYLPEDQADIQEIKTLLDHHISPPNLQESENILCKKMHTIVSVLFAGSAIVIGTYLFAFLCQSEKVS